METKVVINPHYGGFMLSELAVQRMAELGSKWAKGELDQTNPYGLYGGDSLSRHDPILVKVVEELGYRAVDGHDDPTGCFDEDGNEHLDEHEFTVSRSGVTKPFQTIRLRGEGMPVRASNDEGGGRSNRGNDAALDVDDGAELAAARETFEAAGGVLDEHADAFLLRFLLVHDFSAAAAAPQADPGH